MENKPKDFREHYASLSDEALLSRDRSELVEAAQQCYDEELARRYLVQSAEILPGNDEKKRWSWRDEFVCAYTFRAHPGDDTAKKASQARWVLQNARIPCFIERRNVAFPASGPQSFVEYELRVPANLSLQATGTLDREIFNAQIEDGWRKLFAALSQQDLLRADPQQITDSLLDRIGRLSTLYLDELARRGFVFGP